MGNKAKSLFHYTSFSILIQFIHEKIEEFKKINKSGEDKVEHPVINFQGSDDIENLVKEIDEKYKSTIQIILTHFTNDSNVPLIENGEKFELLNSLRQGEFWKFERKLEELLKNEKRMYGIYHEISFKPIAQLYYFFAKNLELQSIMELIFRLCPYVDDSWCLVTTFHEQRFIRIFDDSEIIDRSGTLEKIKSIFGGKPKLPNNYFKMASSFQQNPTSNKNHFKIVWEKFNFRKTPEVLQIVSKL